MRVLMFGWEFPPLITGGLGTACYGLSQSLSHLVEKITFVLPRVKSSMAAGAVQVVGANCYSEAVSVEHKLPNESAAHLEMFAIEALLTPYVTEKQYASMLKQVGKHRQANVDLSVGVLDFSGDYGVNLLEEVVRYGRLAAAIVSSGDYDVIHAHDWLTFLAGIYAQEVSGLPLVVHVHATEFDRSGEAIDQRIYDIERLGMQRADRIVAVSQRTKNVIVEHYGVNPDKVTVVYNGISAAEAPKIRHRPKRLPGKTVSFLGRITMQKGPEYFLEAAYLVNKKLPDVRFVMAGHGDMLPRMIRRMAELRLTERFHFTGFLNATKRDELFSITDLFVMTSVAEPFGLTPIEAMQYDIPVIVPKQAGVSEILNHVIKVDFWDVRKIADAMIHVLTEDSLAKQMVAGCQQDLVPMSWDKAAHEVWQVYKEIS